jgi:beta-glucosidase
MNKILILSSLLFCLATSGNSQSKTNLTIDQKVEALLKQMTLKEKVGQMSQIDISPFIKRFEPNCPLWKPQIQPNVLMEDTLQKYIVDYGIGSMFNLGEHGYTKEEWHGYMRIIQDYAVNKTRLGIPLIYGLDAIKGNSLTIGATLFPQPLGMSCTWNPDLVEQEGAVTAYEMRAIDVLLNFGPNLDLGKHPLWSRLAETYGEDVFLAKTLGKRAVDGMEGIDNIISDSTKITTNIKHFVGYSFPVTGKDRTQAWIPENFLREYFLPSFVESLKAGAHTVILNSAEINGEPIHASKYWITDVLRGELGFDGVILSDWRDIEKLYYLHHVAASYKEAVKMAIDAGIDLNMVPYDNRYMDLLIDLVNEGQISMDRINQSVRRILKLKFELGMFDHPIRSLASYPDFGGEKFKKIAKQSALESMVLLKNTNHVLPLSKTTKVLVTGPTANSMNALNGGWTYSWQGGFGDTYAGDKNTILDAIQQKVGAKNVTYIQGSDFNETTDLNKAVEASKNVDVIVLCLGEPPYAETPGFIEDLYIPDAQAELAKALVATGKPVVLVLTEGRPRVISKFEDKMQAVLLSFCPGNEGGDAFADVLFGDYNPNGKLTVTYPRYPNDLMNYDYKETDLPDHHWGFDGHQPQYRFGFGLSYTTFGYSNLKINKDTIAMKDKIVISVEVTNTGKREGQEVVQLYSRDVVAKLVPPLHRLRAFEKVNLKPGETQTVNFTLTIDDLKYVNKENKWVTEPGDFEFYIDKLMVRLNLK